ncbi:MAG: hypothetical protein A2Z88_09500 [Omnitrophica WOR_2 bacterium GWA2_47_8]|nr:MAG: hypothetical protein A2Z88_09500 [Omnitrophica WOR_2 bacterium GWA2_47_8]
MTARKHPIILVIDDHPIMHRVLEKRLKSQGYEYRGAQDAFTGLRMVKEEHPDLILMDILLPEINGRELTKRLKADPQTKDIPVVFISVTLSKKNDKEEKEIVIDGVTYPAFAKPLYTPKLQSVIRKILKQKFQDLPDDPKNP